MLIHGISVLKPPPDYITYLVPDWKNSQSRIPITPTQKTPSRKQISLEGKSKKQIQQALEDYLSTLASDEEDEEVTSIRHGGTSTHYQDAQDPFEDFP
ncbi:hypothetical protein ACSQ67_024173 [Phaseolus vulgaris]